MLTLFAPPKWFLVCLSGKLAGWLAVSLPGFMSLLKLRFISSNIKDQIEIKVFQTVTKL